MLHIKHFITTLRWSCIALSLAVHSLNAQETGEWWFDIEIIAFKRNIDSSKLPESFDQVRAPKWGKRIDLFSLAYHNQYSINNHWLNNCSLTTLPFASSTESMLSPISISAAPLFGESTLENSYSIIDNWYAMQHEPLELPSLLCPPSSFYGDIVKLDNNSMSPIHENGDYLVSQKPSFSGEQLPSRFFSNALLDESVAGLHHQLLTEEIVHLSALADNIYKQRDLILMLHTGWRQEVVFGESEAQSYRIFAGEFLSSDITRANKSNNITEKTTDLSTINNDDNFFIELKKAITSPPQSIDWPEKADKSDADSTAHKHINTWELEGGVKVYLKYIDRVPYLHVNTDLLLNEWKFDANTNSPTLVQFDLSQRRRVISKQVHYFDHPRMGFIIYINRYKKEQ